MNPDYEPIADLRDRLSIDNLGIHALRSTVRWQTGALDAIRDGVLITDARLPGEPLTYANTAFERMTGYSASEITGTNCRFLQGKDTDPGTIATIREAIAHQRACSVTILNYRKSGESFWNDLRISPMHDQEGELTHYVAAINDISDRIKAFDRLQQSEAEAKDLFASLDFGFCVIQLIYDEEGRAVDWLYLETNQHFEEQSGLRDVRGRRISQVLPDVEVSWLERFATIAATGTAQRFVESSPALNRWFDVHGFQFGDIGPDCVALTFTDITERKQEEERIVSARDTAEQFRVSAEAASRAKSSFLANMSHDIRTPLTAILGFAEILEQTLTEPDDLQATAIIRQNVDYLESLLGDILDLAKIEAGKLPVRIDKLSLPELIEDVVSLMQARASMNGLRLSVSYLTPVPEFVASDRIRVRQILINLLSNAIKFANSQPGSPYDIALKVSFDAHAPLPLRIDVEDFGIGISDEQQKALFEPFVQLENQSTGQHVGSGLGLSICRRLVDLLEGDVSLISALGAGSTFTVTLPVPDAHNISLVTPVKPARSQTHKRLVSHVLNARILVVDDRPEIRSLLQSHLESAGAKVVSVADGQSAITRIAGQHTADGVSESGVEFDLVLMDMQMPGLDGFQTTLSLRQSGFDNPIIALTASVLSEEQQRCLDVGCNHVLSKPIRREHLIEKVAGIIAPDRARRALTDTQSTNNYCPNPLHQMARESAHHRSNHLQGAEYGATGTILFVEDDRDAVRAMTRIMESDGWSVIVATTIREAIKLIGEHQLTLILTDYVLPDGTAENLIESISTGSFNSGPPMILLSGTPDSDLELDPSAFAVQLLKPVSRQSLLEALHSVAKDQVT